MTLPRGTHEVLYDKNRFDDGGPIVKASEDTGEVRFRVWIATCNEPCRGDALFHEPETVAALEPAEEGPMSAEEAAVYVEAFNRAATDQRRKFRAVAVPVTVIYRGEPRPGEALDRQAADAQLDRAQKKPATRLLGIGAPRALTAGVSLTPHAVSLAERRQRGNRT